MNISVEARINALLTRDPNLLKVYTDGYDSHCINTAAYASGSEDWFPVIDHANNEYVKDQKFYKVTQDNGDVLYVTEPELAVMQLQA